MPKEMAHYALECWDAEILTSVGWQEVVGISNRVKYLYVWKITPNREKIEDHFKDEKKLVMKSLRALKQADVAKMDCDLMSGQATLEIGEEQKKCVILDKAMISIKKNRKNTSETFTPAVIEPGFSIGRIVYCLCEHMFCSGEKGKQPEAPYVFRFLPSVAPYKCGVFTLVNKGKLADVAANISKCLTKEAKLNHKTDFSVKYLHVWKITPNREKIEDHFKDEKKLVMKSLWALKQADVAKMDCDLKSGQATLEIGEEQKKSVILDKAMISIKKKRKNTSETFTPAVISLITRLISQVMKKKLLPPPAIS
nr:hypothetical protein [Tanacetum cinerariifolium]